MSGATTDVTSLLLLIMLLMYRDNFRSYSQCKGGLEPMYRDTKYFENYYRSMNNRFCIALKNGKRPESLRNVV